MGPVPDFIGALREHLETVLSVPVYAQMPSPRPPVFVYVDRSGGWMTLSSDTCQVTFEAWAGTKKAAYDLAAQLRSHIVRELPPVISGVRVVSRREMVGPSYEPPTVTGVFRYRMTFVFKHQLGSVSGDHD